MSKINTPCDGGYSPSNEAVSFQDSIAMSLYKDRVIMFSGEVTDQTAEFAIAELRDLAKMDPKKPIEIDLITPGGSITAGLALIDEIMACPCPIITVCKGLCASMGAVILSCGDVRLIQKNAYVLIHQGRVVHGNEMETLPDMAVNFRMLDRENDRILGILADNCGKKLEEVRQATDRDRELDSKEALDFGIVDRIIEYGKPIVLRSSDVESIKKRYAANAERDAADQAAKAKGKK